MPAKKKATAKKKTVTKKKTVKKAVTKKKALTKKKAVTKKKPVKKKPIPKKKAVEVTPPPPPPPPKVEEKPKKPKQGIPCEHCDTTGVCAAGETYDKSRGMVFGAKTRITSCTDCLLAAGQHKNSKKLVDCRFCDGDGEI
jgi:type IV secretory pathway VirB10-like protein